MSEAKKREFKSLKNKPESEKSFAFEYAKKLVEKDFEFARKSLFGSGIADRIEE